MARDLGFGQHARNESFACQQRCHYLWVDKAWKMLVPVCALIHVSRTSFVHGSQVSHPKGGPQGDEARDAEFSISPVIVSHVSFVYA